MNPQSSGSAGPQRPQDGWGCPQQPGTPQQPGPEYSYETPDDFRTSPAGGASPSTPYGRPASPIPGMTPKEFERMCRSVDKAFAQFAKVVEQGVNEAAAALGTKPEDNLKAYEELSRKKQAKAQKRQAERERQAVEAQRRAAQAQAAWQAQQAQRAQGGWGAPGTSSAPAAPASSAGFAPASPWAPGGGPLAKGRFRSSWGLTVSGVLMTAAGGMGALFCGATTLGVIATTAVGTGAAGIVAAGLCAVVTAAFATLLGFGIRNLRTASQLKAFQRVFGAREVCTFDELAARTQTTPKKVQATARKLLRRGLIPQGRIDDESTTLMVTDGAYRQYRQLQQAQRQALADQQAAEAARAAEAAAQAAREQDLNDRLTPAERAFVNEGRAYLAQLRSLDEAIDDAAVSERIVAIEEVVGRILARAEEEPKVIVGLDRLGTYYLPTTVKLLAAYESLEEQPVQGENISTSRQDIERTLGVLHSAFEKLFDDTYQDLSLDVSADISVLHAMLAQEGLTDGPFDARP